MQKNVKLPKESIHMTTPDSGENVVGREPLIDGNDVEGHGLPLTPPDSGENVVGREPLIDGNDVEGHGLPLTPPPSFGSQRTPGHGG